jgi:DNA-binding LytR/AlgR family response regulator
MNKIKLAIVEDEIIIAKTIVLALETLGYDNVGISGKYKDAIEMIAQNKPDLVLLDINLGTKKDGIDLAFEIKKRFNTPIIFITANSDPATISRAKEINPLAFLVKPFTHNDLFSAIEIGWNNFNAIVNSNVNPPKYAVLKVGPAYKKIVFDDIVYLKKDHHYFDIYLTSGQQILVRYSTSEMVSLLPVNQFIKINRSSLVNVRQITKIESKFVYLSDLKLLISKGIQEELLLMM